MNRTSYRMGKPSADRPIQLQHHGFNFDSRNVKSQEMYDQTEGQPPAGEMSSFAANPEEDLKERSHQAVGRDWLWAAGITTVEFFKLRIHLTKYFEIELQEQMLNASSVWCSFVLM